jgi:hypothetical protein
VDHGEDFGDVWEEAGNDQWDDLVDRRISGVALSRYLPSTVARLIVGSRWSAIVS